MSKKEIRSMIEDVDYNEDEDVRYIEGYALKFDTWSDDLGGFVETVSRDALNDTDFSDVRALFNHDPNMVLARTTAGTLELDVDDIGLRFKAQIPKTSYGNDVAENLRNGNLTQCSFGFILDDGGDEYVFDEENNIYKRTLKKIRELFDISAVTYPAYRDTEVAPAIRSLEQAKNEIRKKKLKMYFDII